MRSASRRVATWSDLFKTGAKAEMAQEFALKKIRKIRANGLTLRRLIPRIGLVGFNEKPSDVVLTVTRWFFVKFVVQGIFCSFLHSGDLNENLNEI